MLKNKLGGRSKLSTFMEAYYIGYARGGGGGGGVDHCTFFYKINIFIVRVWGAGRGSCKRVLSVHFHKLMLTIINLNDP